MQVKGIRVLMVIAAIAATLALLFGVQYVHGRFNIEQPLFKLYSDTKLVSSPTIEKTKSTTVITLTMNRTDNLFSVYQDLRKSTEEILGNTNFQIIIKDKRSSELEEAFFNSQFITYEALAKGNYTLIPAEVEQIAEAIGAEAKVNIDQDNIYISFYKGDNYLYEIIPRQNFGLSGNVADRMGSENQ